MIEKINKNLPTSFQIKKINVEMMNFSQLNKKKIL